METSRSTDMRGPGRGVFQLLTSKLKLPLPFSIVEHSLASVHTGNTIATPPQGVFPETLGQAPRGLDHL
jgi:hypothetical protein